MNPSKKRRPASQKQARPENTQAKSQEDLTERPRLNLEIQMDSTVPPENLLNSKMDKMMLKADSVTGSHPRWRPVSEKMLLSTNADFPSVRNDTGSHQRNGNLQNHHQNRHQHTAIKPKSKSKSRSKNRQHISRKAGRSDTNNRKKKRVGKKTSVSTKKGAVHGAGRGCHTKSQKVGELKLNILRRKQSGCSVGAVYPQVGTPMGKKIKKTNFLRLNARGRAVKPVKVRYSVTSKHSPDVDLFPNRRDVLLRKQNLDRRNFNSVDLMSDDVRLQSNQGFFRRKSRRTVDSAHKHKMRPFKNKKKKGSDSESHTQGLFSRRNTVNSGKSRLDDAHNFFHTNLAKKRKFRQALDVPVNLVMDPRAYADLGVGGARSHFYQKHVGMRKALTQVHGREAIAEVLSLKGLENAYFDAIYQRLNKKMGVKEGNKKRRGKKRKSSGKMSKSRVIRSGMCMILIIGGFGEDFVW